jgi:antitoxin CcdA
MGRSHAYAQSLARRPVNVTLCSELVSEARELGIPLSATFEAALRERVTAERERRWLEENRQAIEEYNARATSDEQQGAGSFGSQFGNI